MLLSTPALPRSIKLEDVEKNPAAVKVPFCKLECAHILSESINQDIHKDDNKKEWAASVWKIFEHFGRGDILHELKGPLVHRLENILSLCADLHDPFDTLDIWLEHVGNADGHRYRVCGPAATLFSERYYSDDGIIEFTTPDEKAYPLPSRRYIQLHAAACQVAHLSGAVDYFEKIDRALDEDGVLAEDGHQMYVLADRLRQVICPAYGLEHL